MVEILTTHDKRLLLNRSILSILEKGPQTIYGLSCAVKARHSVILNAMNRLENLGIVHHTRKTGRVTVWGPSDFYKNISAKQKRVINLSRKNKQVLIYLTTNGPATRRILARIQLKLIAEEFDGSGAAWYSSLISPSEVLSVPKKNKGGGG